MAAPIRRGRAERPLFKLKLEALRATPNAEKSQSPSFHVVPFTEQNKTRNDLPVPALISRDVTSGDFKMINTYLRPRGSTPNAEPGEIIADKTTVTPEVQAAAERVAPSSARIPASVNKVPKKRMRLVKRRGSR